MEQLIVFAYDTGSCQSEADDPQKAVLFFYPNWVSEQQRLALCGQLMGVRHFCANLFSNPTVISLQSGKFVLKTLGKYVLSVGSDQSLPDWILKDRFAILQALLQFYHNDFETVSGSVQCDYNEFLAKLSQILDTYIPVLQTAVTSVGSIPSLHYYKGSKSVFLEAVQLLDVCCANSLIIGGSVIHNGRIVASHFDSMLNKILVLTDPHRVKTGADPVSTPFRLPIGVQLFKVYLKTKALNNIKQKYKSAEESGKRPLLRPSIFTVPEDEPLTNKKHIKPRPRKNSKKLEYTVVKERARKFKSNTNLSVCSTPTIEKKSIHDELVSICSGKLEMPTIPDVVKDSIIPTKPEKSPFKTIQRISMDDQMIDFSHTAFPVPLRYYSFGLPTIYKDSAKPKKTAKKYKTVADPMYPVFRQDGNPISKALYKQCLEEHYKDLMAANKSIDSREEFIRTKNLENLLKADISQETPVEAQESVKKIDQKVFRRSLTLPLKPMSLDENTDKPTSPRKCKLPPCVTPSTPLLTKLSLLTLEEQQIVTESEDKKALRTVKEQKLKKSEKEPKQEDSSEVVSCGLFVCGHKNMSLHLLIDESATQNPDLILMLWEAAISNLERIDAAWQKSAEQLSEPQTSNSYSFLTLDATKNYTLKKHGPWPNDDAKTVASLRQHMSRASNISEVIVRSEDSVVYGYRSGNLETFYQQNGCTFIGLPTPADLMGVVTLKARRRLERDHNVLLL